MKFYASVIDGQLRRSNDQPTVEYMLRNINSPIAVVTHRLPQHLADNLPTVEQLEMEPVIAEIAGEDALSVF